MQIESICLSILKSAFWNTRINIDKDFDEWDRLLDFAKKQSILGIVGYSIINNKNYLTKLSESVYKQIKAIVVNNIITSHQVDSALVKIYSTLEDNHINPILLKGQGIARYYQVPELRQCGDIDFFVGEKYYRRAYDILSHVATKIDDKVQLKYGKHFHMYLGKIQFDIHSFSGLYCLKKYNEHYQQESYKGLSNNLVQIKINDYSVNTPSIEFNAYYTFNHLFDHFLVSGIGLRHLCDLMMYLHSFHNKLNFTELHRILIKMDVLYPWQVFGNILVSKLGLPSEEFPFYKQIKKKKIDIIYSHILDEGNFGYGTNYYQRRSKFYIVRKFKSLIWYTSRSLNLITIFPKQIIRHWFNILALGFTIVSKDLIYDKEFIKHNCSLFVSGENGIS